MNENLDHLGRYVFTNGEVVTVGGNPNVLAEVVDASEPQLKVKMLTQPNRGKFLYTTRYTYFTRPMPHLTPQEVTDKVNGTLSKSVEKEEEKSKTEEIPETLENISFEVEENQFEKIEEEIPHLEFEESGLDMEQMSLF